MTIDTVVGDLARAARQLLRDRLFTTLAVVPLAMAIGLNAAMFGVIDAILFRPPLHVKDPDRLIRLTFVEHDPLMGPQVYLKTNAPALQDVAGTQLFSQIAGYTAATVGVGEGTEVVKVNALLVTPAFFRTLGTTPYLGTLLAAGADSLADDRVVMSHALWERHFSGDPTVVGRRIRVEGSSRLVSGIAPPGFNFGSNVPIDVWLPVGYAQNDRLLPTSWRTSRSSYWLSGVARLRPAESSEAVAAQATQALQRIRSHRGDSHGPTGIVPASIVIGKGPERPREAAVSLRLGALTTLVLFIACANLANLVLARNMRRTREFAIELALGADSWRIRGRVLIDVLLIAGLGTVGAIVIEGITRDLVRTLLPSAAPLAPSWIQPRSAALVFIGGAVTALLAAAIALAQTSPTRILQSLSLETSIAPRGTRWLRVSLVMTQATLSVALIFAAMLFGESLFRVQRLDLGVDLDRTIQISSGARASLQPNSSVRDWHERAMARLRNLPDVERVALSEAQPYMAGRATAPWTTARPHDGIWQMGEEVAYVTAVGSGFFGTVGATSLRGRDVAESDVAGAERVAILNQPLAQKLFPDSDALGECIFADESATCVRVVGVLDGVWKFSILKRGKMVMYVPLAQAQNVAPGKIVVRTRGDPVRALGGIRAVLQGLDAPSGPVHVDLTRQLAEPEYRPWRLGAILLGTLGTIALIIAALGLYAVVSLAATLRLREIGIRRAMGANTLHVVTAICSEAIVAISAGLVAGCVLALVASAKMGSVLFQTSPTDLSALVASAVILFAVAIIAIAPPLWRALAVSPATALRVD